MGDFRPDDLLQLDQVVLPADEAIHIKITNTAKQRVNILVQEGKITSAVLQELDDTTWVDVRPLSVIEQNGKVVIVHSEAGDE